LTSKKILIFSRAYQNMAGGVEKMSLDLARGLSEGGNSVVILSLDDQLDQSFFEWPPNVEWIKIGIGDPSKRASFISRCKRLKSIRSVAKEIRPDVGIGFQVGSFALLRLATLGLGIKSIAAERNSPDLFLYIRNGKIKRFFANLILFTSYRVAVQFESYKMKYPNWLRSKIVVTPNWVNETLNHERQDLPLRFSILFIGRLTFQKNVTVLLDAVKLLPPDIELTIIGDGPELADLKAKANLLPHSIKFESPLRDLGSAYNKASVLCMPSRWEGFPNVVAESLSHGLPVVGFKLCSGIPELISDGINGSIALGMDNPNTLAEALVRASETHFLSNTIKSTIKMYNFQDFIRHWEASFE
jgi:glycosyltransferase involved in cell wall biosynthesis